MVTDSDAADTGFLDSGEYDPQDTGVDSGDPVDDSDGVDTDVGDTDAGDSDRLSFWFSVSSVRGRD